MNKRYVVARVVASGIQESKSDATSILYTVRFRLLDPIIVEDKRVRQVYALFSISPRAIWRVGEFLEAIECPIPITTLELPDRRVHHRYCRLGITLETYEGHKRLIVRDFITVNEPFKAPPEQTVNEGLKQLGITAHIENGNLVITPPPKPAEPGVDD